jgi:hypothetical protein
MSQPLFDGLTNKASVVAQAIQAVLVTNQTALGLEDVWYGDQDSIPRYPAVCIEADTKSIPITDLNPMLYARNDFEILLILYDSIIGSVDTLRLQTDQLAEAITDVLHIDIKLGGLVTLGYVSLIQYGYIVKQGRLVRSAKLTWRGLNKTPLLIP